MLKLFGSYNSRFYASLTGSDVRLYRGISAGGGMTQANEAAPVFSKALDPTMNLQIIRVTNSGDLFFRAPQGLYRLRNAPGSNLEVANNTVCALARGDEAGKLGKVSVDAEGRGIFYEVITPEGGLKDKFFKLLGGKKTSGESLMAHQVVYYDVATQRTMNFPATLVDTKRDFNFHWNLAQGGRFLVQARPEKKSYQLEVIDVTDESFFEFKMALAHIEDLWVNDAGVMMVDVRQVGEEKLIIALPDRTTPRQVISPPPSYRVVNLGPLHVSVMLESQKKLQIYEYAGKLVADVDVQPLHQLGVEYHFNFNERGDIDVLAYTGGGRLNIQHSGVKTILTDAKRWANTARQQQAEEEQARLQDVTSQHNQEKKRLQDFNLSRQLADAVVTDAPPPQVLPGGRLPGERAPMGPQTPLPAMPMMGMPNTAPPNPAPPPPPAETPPWMAGLTPPQAPAPPLMPPPLPPSAPAPPPGMIPNPALSSLPSRPPSTPMAPLPPPGAPSAPTSLPVPGMDVLPVFNSPAPTLPPAPVYASPPPLPPLMPPVTPAPPPPAAAEPPAAAPTPAPSPAPTAAPALPFLRGAAPMPPPDTENEEEVAVTGPAVPELTTPVNLDGAALASYTDVTSVDAELERLRMTYIAGEISRENYYTRRAELEAIRRSLQGSGGGSLPAAPSAGPKRLDLDLDSSPPSGETSTESGSRPRRSLDAGPTLDLPLPGSD